MMMGIQMKLTKVTCTLKNMISREFQPDMESQLIQGSMIKMPEIQFVSMMMGIQIKLMKMICKAKNMMNKEFQLDVESQLT
jgi:hypothetical protein